MFKKDKRREKVEVLYKLKGELKEVSEKYQAETRKEFDEIGKEIEKEIKSLLEDKNHKANQKLEEKIKEKLKKNTEEMEKEKEELNQRVEKMLKKIIEIRFYPPEFIFELNMIKGLVIEMEDNIENNPLIKIEYEERTNKLEKEIDRYLMLHEEVLKLVREETENMDFIKLKEELSRDLQMGRLDDVERKIKTKKSQ